MIIMAQVIGMPNLINEWKAVFCRRLTERCHSWSVGGGSEPDN